MKIRFTWQTVLITLAVLLFVIIKFSMLTYRFGDGNAYFYMAKHLWSGLWPYRDYFLADPPGQVLLLAPLSGIIGHHYLILQALPVIFEAVSAVLIYLILKRNDVKLAYLAPVVYLTSFTVLSTSDYATGAQLTMMLVLLGVYWGMTERPKLSGIVWALAILVKLYAIPLALGYLVYLIYEKKFAEIKQIIVSGLITGAVVLAPGLLMAPKAMIRDVIVHQFHRTSGTVKSDIFGFFIVKEWLWLILALFGSIVTRQRWPLFITILMLGFLLIFKDVYYLYLLTLWPWIVMLIIMLADWMWQELEDKNIFVYWATLAVGLGFVIYSATGYFGGYANVGRFTNAQEIADTVKSLPEQKPVYGSHEVAPLVALLSDKEIFGNYIDTNTQTFASGAQDMTVISTKAAQEGVFLMSRVTDYPDQKIYNIGIEQYISPELFIKVCKEAVNLPSTSNEADNKLKVFSCKE